MIQKNAPMQYNNFVKALTKRVPDLSSKGIAGFWLSRSAILEAETLATWMSGTPLKASLNSKLVRSSEEIALLKGSKHTICSLYRKLNRINRIMLCNILIFSNTEVLSLMFITILFLSQYSLIPKKHHIFEIYLLNSLA